MPWGGKKLQRYYDQTLVGSYGVVAALRLVVPGRRTLVIRTGHVHPSQTGETTFQTSLGGGG